jgi:ABC-type uncharacterized transport system permease subunit
MTAQNIFSKYYGYFLMESKRVKLYLPDMLMSVATISMRLILPWSVFAILAETGEITDEFAISMLWAVLIGQLLTASAPRINKTIKQEVRTGDIATRINEPSNYYFARFSGAIGYFINRFLVLGVLFIVPFWLFIGGDTNPILLLVGIPIALTLFLSINIIVGLTSFIIEESDGLFWITQKLFFVFGNQLIPVALLPGLAVEIARWTPFYMALAAPIEVASGREDPLFALTLSSIYIALFVMLGLYIQRKIQRKLVSNG